VKWLAASIVVLAVVILVVGLLAIRDHKTCHRQAGLFGGDGVEVCK
jgi:hypothetical protein